jgi:hypothetical protein
MARNGVHDSSLTTESGQHESVAVVILTTLRYNGGKWRSFPAMHHHRAATNLQDHCDTKGTLSVTNTPTDDQPGFVAEKPEHCFAWFRLIRPGQTYYPTLAHEVLCADCALDESSA